METYNNELYHYGVLGMKWGVRKARLSATTTRKPGRYYTEDEKLKFAKKSTKVLNKSANASEKRAALYERSAETQRLKGKEYLADQYQKTGEAYAKNAAVMRKRLKDIESGTLKAGRDYVINSTYSTNLILDAVGLPNIRVENQVDFK